MSFLLRLAAGLLACAVGTPQASFAQSSTPDDDQPPAFEWGEHPTIAVGDLRLALRLKLSHDWRTFSPDVAEENAAWRLRRAGVEGQIGEQLTFEVERDLYPGGEWRDVFVNWRARDAMQIKAGRFKVPFTRDELTSSSELDFAWRSLGAEAIAPSREWGVVVHGAARDGRMTYDAGVFRGDGEHAVDGSSPLYAGRATLVVTPAAHAGEELRVGLSLASVDLPAGRHSLEGRSVYGTMVLFAPHEVSGRRDRVAIDAAYASGPFGATAEWMQAREGRQFATPQPPPLVTTGWYAGATWLLTGEQKHGFTGPARPLRGGGAGAFEVALRYERLRAPDDMARGPDSPVESAWTFGLNWFANRWVRATLNAVREEFDFPARVPVPGTLRYWSGLARLQLVF